MTDGQWRDEERLPLDELSSALATYSADGQVDDATGGDAGAEAHAGERPTPKPSPDGPIGPN